MIKYIETLLMLSREVNESAPGVKMQRYEHVNKLKFYSLVRVTISH